MLPTLWTLTGLQPLGPELLPCPTGAAKEQPGQKLQKRTSQAQPRVPGRVMVAVGLGESGP